MTPPATFAPVPRQFRQRWGIWFVILVLAWMAVGRLYLLNFPLERDEGEYAYAGQLILQGIPPYELACNMKFPGTYLAYAAIMAVFGQTSASIHFGLLLLTTATALMLFWLGKKILDPMAGAVAATAYAVLAGNSAMFGFSAHATHFCAFFVTAALCLFWAARRDAGVWMAMASAFLFGVAILMKQHVAIIALWALGSWAVCVLKQKEERLAKRAALLAGFGGAMLLPFALCCLLLWWAGVFGKFWFWTIGYGRAYVSLLPVSEIWPKLWWSLHSMFSDCWLWWFGVAGLIWIWFDRRLRLSRRQFWLAGFAAASLLSTAPGFYFRTHYFLAALPAVALLAGVAVSGMIDWLQQRGHAVLRLVPATIYALVLAVALAGDVDTWSVLGRFGGHALFGPEPFPEAETVAAYVRDHSSPSARLAVIGSEPEIYFLAQRHSATGYIYTYPLMEPQPFARRMQDDMMREIEANQPEFVVYANVESSWLQRPGSDPAIFRWWAGYAQNYELVGVVDMSDFLHPAYRWDAEAAHGGGLKTPGLEVYRRIF